MLSELLPSGIVKQLNNVADIDKINELRLRVDRPIRYEVSGVFYTLYRDDEVMVSSKEDIDYVLAKATSRSMYAYNEQIARGYITYKGGIRIGIAGEGVENVGHLVTFREISYLVIRVPSEMKGISEPIIEEIGSNPCNILIISPPGGGKTTMLRDYIRYMSSSGNNVLLIDERGEIAAMQGGRATLDVGPNTDIISGTNKIEAYKMAIRAMSPSIVATDEVFGSAEIDAILDIMRCGVNVVATIHAKNIENLKNNGYSRLIDMCDYVITLSSNKGIYDAKVGKLYD